MEEETARRRLHTTNRHAGCGSSRRRKFLDSIRSVLNQRFSFSTLSPSFAWWYRWISAICLQADVVGGMSGRGGWNDFLCFRFIVVVEGYDRLSDQPPASSMRD